MSNLGRVTFALCALAAVIAFYPSKLDLLVANLFYSADSGAFIGSEPAGRLMQHALTIVSISYVSLCLCILAINLVAHWRPLPVIAGLRVPSRTVIYLLVALAIGPGIVVNGIFKEHWGRARPRDIVEFGGTKQFTRPFVMSDQCESNCSFVSGEASVGFYGLTFIFVARRRRRSIVVASLLCGSAIGLVRMTVGAHFLSDVVFSGVLTCIVSYLLYLLLLASSDKFNGRPIADAASKERVDKAV